jgi:hypothetical protein
MQEQRTTITLMLEQAIEEVIERLKWLSENGSFTRNDDWMLKHLEEALKRSRQSEQEAGEQH